MNKIYNDYKQSKLEPRHHVRVYPTARGKAILLFLLSLLTASSFSHLSPSFDLLYTKALFTVWQERWNKPGDIAGPAKSMTLCPKPVIFM